jgi:acyl-CoA dehydrogenase
MRAIGMAERALALMLERAKNRTAIGATLADQGVVRELIDQVRLYVYKTAWLIDREGPGAGVSNDTPLAYFYAWARVLRIVDGPDAVHRRSIARQELRRERPFAG